MRHYDKEIVRTSDRQLAEVLSINKELTEKSLRMRCLSYLAEVKSSLLTQTVYEIDRSKKILKEINLDLTSSQINLKKEHRIVALQKEELEKRVKERRADLRHTNRELKKEIKRRTQSEEQLLLFKNLVNRSNDAIFVVDPEKGRFLDVNEKACTTLGYERRELLEMSVPDIEEMIFDQGAWGEQRDFFVREGTALLQGIHIRKDGSTFPVEISVSYIPEGNRSYIIAVARDMSERKRLEAQFLQSQKMEAIGRFAGGIAHDFNNLLTAIIGYSELLLLERSPESRDYEDLKTIRETADRAAQLTRQILAFSKQQTMEPARLDLNKIVGEMNKIFGRILGEDIEFIFEPGENLRIMKADPGQVEQVILNLVVNARDAMPSGGRLTITTDNIHLDEAYAQIHTGVLPGEYILLAITDTGVGMGEEVQAHIFDPYFTTKEEGTGLGLSTVYGIIKQNSGHVYVYSEVGQGTTFKIYFPCVEGAARRDEIPTEEMEKLPTGQETLLVVEDEQTIVALAVQVLESLGYKVLTAMSGEEALKRISEYPAPPDLLLSDVVLPGMGGPEIAARISEEYPGTKILFMSGYADHRISEAGVTAEQPEFLAKPFTPSELARKVRDVLDV